MIIITDAVMFIRYFTVDQGHFCLQFSPKQPYFLKTLLRSNIISDCLLMKSTCSTIFLEMMEVHYRTTIMKKDT